MLTEEEHERSKVDTDGKNRGAASETKAATSTISVDIRLTKGFHAVDLNKDGKICEVDIGRALAKLKFKCPRREVKQMVWEASSNSGGFIELDDCLAMYHRVRGDKSGHEPYRILDLIDFASYDDKFTGKISTVQCMSILTQRSNQVITQLQVKTMASTANWNFSAPVSFEEFSRQVEVRRILTRPM